MKKPLVLALAGLFAVPAFAADPEPVVRIESLVERDAWTHLADASGAKATAEAWRHWADELRTSVSAHYGTRMATGKPVKGAPYSAEIVTESNQSLADGNVISRKTSGRVYRDGEGRTRQETVVDGEAKSIQIADPVEGRSVMLLPGSKKAVAMPRVNLTTGAKSAKVVRLGDREVRVEDGKVTVDGKPVTGKVEIQVNGKEIRVEDGRITIDGKELSASAPPRPGTIAMRHARDEAQGREAREEVHVRVFRAGDGESKDIAIGMPPLPPTPPLPPLPPAGSAHMRIDGALARSKATTTSLGTKEFDGVRAEGSSTVQTIAAGEIGNRNPIMVTKETWFSPELQVTVYSRTLDPRYGESIYRLANIRRGEPGAELFKVPEDYTGAGKGARGPAAR